MGLAAASIPLVLAWSVSRGGAWLGFLSGLLGGVLALTAILRQNERSWLVLLSILPMLNVRMFIFAEFFFPH